MLFLKSWFWLQGQLLIKVEGKETERLLNQCLSRGIYLWDIHWHEGILYFRLSSRSFSRLRPLVRTLKVRVRIVEKSGMPFFLRTFRRRRMLAVGGVLFLLLLYAWSSCIWSVQVKGVGHETQRKELAQMLQGRGIMSGVLKERIDLSAVEQEVLVQFPELAWARAYFTGTRFVLEVVPKLPPPDLAKPGHLVAKKSGLVLDVLVLTGKPLVDKGASVQVGDVLILGDQGRRPVPAKGRVLARIWHECYKEGEPIEQYWVRSGNTASSRVLKVLAREFVLKGVRESPFQHFESGEERKNILRWRNSGGPVEVIDKTYHELKEVRRTLSEKECAQRLMDQALAHLKQNLDEGSKIVQVDKKVLSTTGDSPIRVWVRIEAVEDITTPIPYYPQKREGGTFIGGTTGEESSSGQQ
ncbi:MAG TPA: sporulation protein YqfD [Firmicutes bacterium]|nr:sporulation protein YqfD [Bacillota bacterium]